MALWRWDAAERHRVGGAAANDVNADDVDDAHDADAARVDACRASDWPCRDGADDADGADDGRAAFRAVPGASDRAVAVVAYAPDCRRVTSVA